MDMIRIFYGTKLVVAVIVLVVEIGAENNLFFCYRLQKIFDEGKSHQTIKPKKLRHEENGGLKHLFDQF